VVTDTLTGLVWLQDANCMANQYPGFDNDSTAGDGAVTWQHALDFVAGMTVTGLYSDCAAGFSDWRLPNVRELQSIPDYGRYPSVPTEVFDNLADDVWSSTSYANDPDGRAWYTNLPSGQVRLADKTTPRYVWPVRGGE
jgi:hypothetical protein